MPWTVHFHPDFEPEFEALPEPVQEELLSRLRTLGEFGPSLGRPTVDTLKATKHKNMKELRFTADGIWRFAFAFDPLRQGIVLCGGDKEGVDERLFYERLIARADRRYDEHLLTIEPPVDAESEKSSNKRSRKSKRK